MCAHVQKIQRHTDILEKLNMSFDKEISIDMMFNSFTSSYDQFILTYRLNNTKTTLTGLHNLLQIVKVGMKNSHSTMLQVPRSWLSNKESER